MTFHPGKLYTTISDNGKRSPTLRVEGLGEMGHGKGYMMLYIKSVERRMDARQNLLLE
jgi:hypothetical protein